MRSSEKGGKTSVATLTNGATVENTAPPLLFIRSQSNMQRPILRLGVSLAVALGIVWACGGGDKPTDPDSLLISANPRQINDQGQASTIEVTATTGDGSPGTGTVTLHAL